MLFVSICSICIYLVAYVMQSSAFNLFSMFSNTKSTFLDEQREAVAREQRRASSAAQPIVSLHPSEPHICVNSFNNNSISIPPSRVNDGICDCCNGSDEFNMVQISECADNCEHLAQVEIALARKRSTAYIVGKKIRQHAIDSAQQSSSLATSIQSIRDEIEQLNRQRDNVDQVLREKESSVSERIDSVRINTRPRVDAILGLTDLDDSLKAGFLLSIFDVFEMQTVDSIPLPPGWDLLSHDHDRNEADYHDRDSYNADPENNGLGINEDGDHHMNDARDVPESQEDSSQISSFCQQVRERSDARLSALFSSCFSKALSDSEPSEIDMSPSSLIYHILETKSDSADPLSSYYRVQMAMAYYRLKGYFGYESVEFVTTSENKPCSSVLVELNAEISPDALQMNCEVAELLQYAFQPLHLAIQENSLNVDEQNEIENSRNALNTLANDIQSLRTQVNDLEKEESEREKFMPDFVEYFTLRNSCFEKKDGQYTYRVCLGRDIQQIDEGASSGTSLGTFDYLEKDASTGGVTIYYKDGQYCHAFGPRTARVHVSCGENATPVLSSASEPSTCAYRFSLEAANACTHEFALLHSIPDQ